MIDLLDTHALSDLLREKEPVKTRFTGVRDRARFILCPVVDYAIQRYLLLKGATRNLAQNEALVGLWLKPAFDVAHDGLRFLVFSADREEKSSVRNRLIAFSAPASPGHSEPPVVLACALCPPAAFSATRARRLSLPTTIRMNCWLCWR